MSLQRRLVLSLGLAFLVIWTLAAGLLFMDLRDQIRQTLDQRLAASARMVAGLVANRPELGQPLAAPKRIQAPEKAGVACEVRSRSGQVLLRTDSAAGADIAGGGAGYQTRTINGEPWRLYTMVENDLMITTADQMSQRSELERGIILVVVAPFALALAGGLGAVAFGVSRGLRPLNRLRTALSRRQPDALDPVRLPETPAELASVIDTLNALLARIREAIDREKRFTNNAAHELRTPLAGIRTHLQVALGSQGQTRQAAIEQAETSVDRLSGMVDNLLMLARVESGANDEPARAALDQAVRDALSDLPDIERVRVDGLSPDVFLAVPASLLAVGLRNLLDNALRHTGADGHVHLTIDVVTQGVDLCICDEGDGAALLADGRLGQRFWRGAGSGGSGLGLAIVQAIVDQYEGELRFAEASAGGLAVHLIFPRAA